MPAIGVHHTATVDATWDGPGQVAKANGQAELHWMHAWYAGDGPDLKGSYKFPHHAAGTGTAANLNGVRNALARLANSSIPAGDKAGVEAHLNAHLKDGGGTPGGAKGAPAREQRAAAYEGDRHAAMPVMARMTPFRGFFERQSVLVNGKSMEQLDGYASVTGVEYEMWDMFGPYGETMDPRAFDHTLAASPDVAFLVNHKGMTMARTPNTLNLDVDPRGLHSQAFVNPERSDVRDLLIAIDDGHITEMSFAFMLVEGEWDEEFEHFRINQVDIDRGDVSAVNYGANPYTDIGARAHQVLADVEHLPRAAQEAAYKRLAAKFGELRVEAATPAALRAAKAMEDETGKAAAVVTQARGMSVEHVAALLSLDD